jgi:3D (Asp-Asp-Asp) domain-containing protein
MSLTKYWRAKSTGYYPDDSLLEGGFVDRRDRPLQTLQDFLDGKCKWVSVAMDTDAFEYGAMIRIPEIEQQYGRVIPFRVVDTGGAFAGTGYSRIDICVRDRQASYDDVINWIVTLIYLPMAQTPIDK